MSNTSQESNFLKITRYIDEHGLEFGNVATNGFAYALVSIFYSRTDKVFGDFMQSKTLALTILILGFIINLLFFWKQSEKSKTLRDIIEVNNEQAENIQNLENKIQLIHRNYSEIFNEHLASLFFKLNLKDSERISMYKFENEKFYIIGRYSSNPTLTKIKRNFYKSEQGLISKAWANGEFFLNSGVPDYGNKARNKTATFNFFNGISQIDRVILEAMTMKSKSFYLKAFMDSKGIQRNSIIVIESEKNRAFEKEIIDKLVSDEESKLTSFVEKIEWNFPNLDNAQNSGF